jgi:hypothetical protein
LLEQIDKAAAVTYYNNLNQLWQAPRIKELPSLPEFLGLVFNKPAVVENQFDEKTDKFFEEYARKKFLEGQAQS